MTKGIIRKLEPLGKSYDLGRKSMLKEVVEIIEDYVKKCYIKNCLICESYKSLIKSLKESQKQDSLHKEKTQ
jgi:hypothetical protein